MILPSCLMPPLNTALHCCTDTNIYSNKWQCQYVLVDVKLLFFVSWLRFLRVNAAMQQCSVAAKVELYCWPSIF